VKHKPPEYGAPPRFQTLMGTLDPSDASDSDVVIARDLLDASDLTKAELHEIKTWLISFLADPLIVTADIKGLLNRNLAYNPSDLSGRALLEAVVRELRKLA